MIMRNICICLRCQKGGAPQSSVYIITPHAHISTSLPYPGTFSYIDTAKTSGAKYPGVPHSSVNIFITCIHINLNLDLIQETGKTDYEPIAKCFAYIDNGYVL